MCKEQNGFVLWFTGLPCSGKTTIADAVAVELKKMNLRVERLDGDVIRQGLTKDLGFSKEDRDKNIERVTFVAKLLSRNGIATLVSFVSPYREKRQQAREQTTNFIEVYVKCPVDVCRQRDVRGMYAKALRGEIKDFTGVDDPYEEPLNPEVVLETDKGTVQESTDKVIKALKNLGLLHERIWNKIAWGRPKRPLENIPEKKPLTPEDKERVKEQLRSLGYM